MQIDPELLKNGDTRNVIDKYRFWTVEAIKHDMAKHSTKLQIAIENVQHDFNMGTIVRNANAFCVRTVHIIGRKQWNKRGAMMTDAYLEVIYHSSVSDFIKQLPKDYHLIAIDNQAGAKNLSDANIPEKSILVFGSESDGISTELSSHCELMVKIEQFGSTRSVNVGVASGILMYEWMNRFFLKKKQ